jgi:hypothetical protein
MRSPKPPNEKETVNPSLISALAVSASLPTPPYV